MQGVSAAAIFCFFFLVNSLPGNAAVAAADHLRVDGSSTVYPLTEAVAEEMRRVFPDERIAIGVSGTGGGMNRFCRGELEVVQASREMKPVEAAACELKGIGYARKQVAFDAIAIVVNSNNTWAQELTLAELKKLWEPASLGQQHPIKTWRDLRPAWPDKKIELYGPGTDSGTFDYFTKTIVGKSGATRSDFTSSEDDNLIVTAVSGSPNALGYLGFSYYHENRGRLRAVAIERFTAAAGDTPKFVIPSYQSVQRGEYAPLTRPLLLYARKGTVEPTSSAIARFLDFYEANGDRLAREVGLLPVAMSNDLGER